MKTINEMFEEIINRNEGGPDVALKFSDPDGVRSGKSGWSFGDVQWDTQNNPTALECLRKCGFTKEEIKGVVSQSIDVKPLEVKLRANAEVIRQYDMMQLQHCIDSACNFAATHKIPVADSAALLMLADMVNQYGSLGDGSARHLLALGRPVTADDVLDMKLTWKYSGTKRGHDDTVRRYNNVLKVVSENV